MIILSMSKREPYARIAITLPQEVLAAADRLARRLDRSRSWVIAEAIRRLEVQAGCEKSMVRETGVSPYSGQPGLGPSRLAQLEADLSLSPEERVKAAEETARVDRYLRPARGDQLLFFDELDSYVHWKQRQAALG